MPSQATFLGHFSGFPWAGRVWKGGGGGVLGAGGWGQGLSWAAIC